MLEVFTGVPGSGKTYYAVDYVYNCFLDNKHKNFGKFKRFFTNINEFKFDTFNDVGDVAHVLDFEDLKKKIYELRILYLQKNPDTVLIEKAKESNIYDTLFIIDEAHNYFADQDDVLVWWLSYHRHLHQDIILITQNINLIQKKYLSFSEFFYRAVPSSLRLFSHVFAYKQFITPQLYKNSLTNTIKLKFRKGVYALYGSGANTQSTKVLYKFLAIAAAAVLVVVLGVNYVSVMFASRGDDNRTKSSDQPINQAFTPVNVSDTFTAVCVGFECSILGQPFKLNDFNKYAAYYRLTATNTLITNDGVTLRTFAKNDQFYREVLNASNTSNVAH